MNRNLPIAILIGILSVNCRWLLETSAGNVVNREYSYSAITIIEDQNTDPPGIFVSTCETSYAVFTPNLTTRNWIAFSRYQNDLYVLTRMNKTLTTKYDTLSEGTRDRLMGIESNFKQNLAGLPFTPKPSVVIYSTASSNSYASSSYANSKRNEIYSADAQLRGNTFGAGSSTSNYADQQRQYSSNYGQQVANYDNFGQSYSSLVYNNLYNSQLNDTLDGDVYQIGLVSDIEDIFSTTVSARQEPKYFVIYRDENYFAYRRPYLPLNVNLIFLSDNVVFFVYNDGSIQIKVAKQLDRTELDLVVEARAYIRKLQRRLNNAVEIQMSDSDLSMTTTDAPMDPSNPDTPDNSGNR